MNKFTQELRHDHQVIDKVLAAMSTVADLMELGQELQASTLAGLVQFLRIFAGEYHQNKEERYLFPLLETKGSIEINRRVEQLQRGYGEIAEVVNRLASISLIYSSDPEAVKPSLIASIQRLTKLYPALIWQEEYLLLPLAEHVLTDTEQSILENKFLRITQEMGADVHDAFEELASRFALVVEYSDTGACPLCSPAA
jgi:hemerythrin-like domain-containing protein